MTKGSYRGVRLRRARVEIVPLIDVMFLLVAFFMVISISMVVQKGIIVDLAPSQTADAALNDDTLLVVSVGEAGDLFLNKTPISPEELFEALHKKSKESPESSVVLNADKQAKHEDVIAALDVIRRSSLQNVVFSVEPQG
jgi:biopolymer transport protein ExbD